MTAPRVCLAIGATPPAAKQATGKTSEVTHPLTEVSMGIYPVAGSTAISMAKTRTRTRPSQAVGTLMPTIDTPSTVRATGPPRSALRSPKPTPSKPQTTAVPRIKESVTSRRELRIEVTDSPVNSDDPRSPQGMPSQLKY